MRFFAENMNWMITSLIAKWGIDQLTAKAVSVTLGSSSAKADPGQLDRGRFQFIVPIEK